MARLHRDPSNLERNDAALREMLQAFGALPLPSRLRSVVDQLDEPAAAPAVAKRRRGVG